jgi:hypothetical protein
MSNQLVDFPDFTGYWFVKGLTDDDTIELKYVCNGKPGMGVELWECPGIGRHYVCRMTKQRLARLKFQKLVFPEK